MDMKDIMKTHVDENGMYHDKPVGIDGAASSSNAWIYSAYAKMLGLPINRPMMRMVATECLDSDSDFQMNRLPGKAEPPMSRDELIGLVSLGLLDANDFISTKWLWVKQFEMFDAIPLLRQMKALWSLKDKHRNHVWQYKVYDAYPMAFRLWWHDRFYVKTMSGTKPSIFECLMFKLYELSIKRSGSDGERNLLYLQLVDMRMYRSANNIDVRSTLKNYFGEDHIFSRIK